MLSMTEIVGWALAIAAGIVLSPAIRAHRKLVVRERHAARAERLAFVASLTPEFSAAQPAAALPLLTSASASALAPTPPQRTVPADRPASPLHSEPARRSA